MRMGLLLNLVPLKVSFSLIVLESVNLHKTGCLNSNFILFEKWHVNAVFSTRLHFPEYTTAYRHGCHGLDVPTHRSINTFTVTGF